MLSEDEVVPAPDCLHKKVTFLGGAKAGKSCLVGQLVDGSFAEEYKPTYTASFKFISEGAGEEELKLGICDLPCQINMDLCKILSKDAWMIYFVYDSTSRESFEELESFLRMVNESVPDAIKVLVATKIDLVGQREVSPQDGQQFADANGFEHFIETSALTGANITALKDWSFAKMKAEVRVPEALRQEVRDPRRQRFESLEVEESAGRINPAWTQIHNNFKSFNVWRKNTDGIRLRPTGIGKMSRTLFFNKRIGNEELLRRFREMALSRISTASGTHRHDLTKDVYNAIVEVTQSLANRARGHVQGLNLDEMVTRISQRIEALMDGARQAIAAPRARG